MEWLQERELKSKMLVSVKIGNQLRDLENEWSIIRTEGKNSNDGIFIGNDAIHQRIRINQRVDIPDELEKISGIKDKRITAYNMPKGRWVNNNKNMNPLWVNLGKETDTEYFSATNVLYVTLSSEFRMTVYRTFAPIYQVYNARDKYTGCAIVFSNAQLDELKKSNPKNSGEAVLLDISAYNKITKKYQKIKVSITDKGPKVTVDEIHSPAMIDKMKKSIEKHPKTSLSFKVKLTDDIPLLTSTYLFSDKLAYVNKKDEIAGKTEEVSEFIDRIYTEFKNPTLIIAEDDYVDDSYIVDCLTQNRIRAITCVGISPNNQKLSKLSRDARLLYVFHQIFNEENQEK